MIIRNATLADAPAIATLRERTIRTIVAPLNLYSSDEIESWASNFTIERVISFINDGNYLVADDGGRVVGIGRLRIDSPKCATIRGVFVDADFVGRGIGSDIVRRLFALAENLGINRIDLVATLNARSFYERLGFVLLDRVLHETPNGTVIPGLRMRRDALVNYLPT